MKTAKKLQLEVTKLRAEIQQKDVQLELKNTHIKNLEAALIDLKKHRFGSSSENKTIKINCLFSMKQN
jgi:hypothetical protein